MNTTGSRLGTLGLGLAIMFFASAPAEATLITSVVVTANGVTYNAGNVGWAFPVNLLTGQDLVLSQYFQGPANDSASYNFDTSDNPMGIGPTIPQITITADGVTTTFLDTNQILNVKDQGSVAVAFSEAQNYGAALVGPGYQVFLGYADNVHNGPCGQYATTLGLLGSTTCFPSPFSGATVFQGRGALVPIDPATGVVVPEPSDGVHCSSALQNCYDAGVIRIVGSSSQVPEPATMSLLLTGLAGLIAQRYRQARKTARNRD